MTGLVTCWREALANLLATPYRFALVAVVLATTVAYAGSREASAVHELDIRAMQLRVAGSDVVVATGRDGGVPAAACERLGSLGGVRSAGALRSDGQVVIPTNPQSTYDTFTASPGMAHVLTVRAATGSVLVGGAMARELGLVSRSGLDLSGVVRRVTVLPETSARSQLVDRGVVTLAPAAASWSGSCYVELQDGGADSAAAWLPAELAMPRGQLVVSPLLSGGSGAGVPGGASPENDFRHRADRYDWLLLPLVPLTVWLLLVRSRRTELALYSLSGARPAHVALLLWLEALAVAVVGAVVALAAVAVGAHGDGLAGTAGVRAGALSLCVALGGVLVGAVATGFRRRGEFDLLRSSR